MPRWQDEAACKGADVNIFFPSNRHESALACQYCKKCPVKQECLDFAVTEHLEGGVYGGLSEAERDRLRRLKARRCETCDAEYLSTSHTARYCPDCRGDYRHERAVAARRVQLRMRWEEVG